MTDPVVLSPTETSLELNEDRWDLARVGDEGLLRDPDGRVVLSAPWEHVPVWLKRLFSAVEAEAAADRGPVFDTARGRA